MKRNMIENVPLDVIVEILIRLPARTLLRFKRVCNSWRSLISDPFFIDFHLKFSSSTPDTLIMKKNRKRKKKKNINGIEESFFFAANPSWREKFCFLCNHGPSQIDFPSREANSSVSFQLVSSCNGLVSLWYPADLHQPVSLWNPSTMETHILPFSGVANFCPVQVGFGFHRLAAGPGDYKVVIISLSNELNPLVKFNTLVYSLRMDSWKQIDNSNLPQNMVPGYYSEQVWLNGSVHWLTNHSGDRGRYVSVLSFNMADETFREMSLPQNIFSKEKLMGAAEGRLCVVAYNFYATKDVEVWVMKEYGVGEFWTKLFVISPPERWGADGNVLRPVGVTRSGQVVLKRRKKGRLVLISYDPKRKVFEGFGNWVFGSDTAESIESLVSVTASLVSVAPGSLYS
ncbi:F-box/kelch-repeat protein At3g23880-like [Malania oleifera]|uniref:F-box/kelch-repeat protein At3g23880-like n=1 Tax=Malania oleifera TaxID=397392 RepID=UPI0025AE53A2|nr:F-box/kelch-repeat protein At3g23880-like [Malania oleifera]